MNSLSKVFERVGRQEGDGPVVALWLSYVLVLLGQHYN